MAHDSVCGTQACSGLSRFLQPEIHNPQPSGSPMAELQPLPTPVGIFSSSKSGTGKGAPSSLITPHVSHLPQVQWARSQLREIMDSMRFAIRCGFRSNACHLLAMTHWASYWNCSSVLVWIPWKQTLRHQRIFPTTGQGSWFIYQLLIEGCLAAGGALIPWPFWLSLSPYPLLLQGQTDSGSQRKPSGK